MNCLNCIQRSRLWAVAVCVRITFQTKKMLGRATNLRIEHSPAIAYEPLLATGRLFNQSIVSINCLAVNVGIFEFLKSFRFLVIIISLPFSNAVKY